VDTCSKVVPFETASPRYIHVTRIERKLVGENLPIFLLQTRMLACGFPGEFASLPLNFLCAPERFFSRLQLGPGKPLLLLRRMRDGSSLRCAHA